LLANPSAAPGPEQDPTRRPHWSAWAVVLTIVSLARTETAHLGPLNTVLLAPADLEGVELVPRPESWRDHGVARDQFRDGWCARKGHTPEACSTLSGNALDNLRDAWSAERDATLENIAALELRGRDLRSADLSGAYAPAVDFGDARLEGADLYRARLEGADLRGARLEGADLRQARLEDADLRGARLEGADLARARPEGADLDSAVLSASDFTATRLNQGQIAGAIGDADTVLPRDAETGEQLYVWSCWEEPPPTLDQMRALAPEALRQALRRDWLCNGRPREKVGRPAPEPEGAPEDGSEAAPAPAP
jgi:hypothetical protein